MTPEYANPLDLPCSHCNAQVLQECDGIPRGQFHDARKVELQPRKPYTAPKLRKLDPRCVILKDNVDFFSVAVAHAPNTYSLTTEICHITNCKCEK